MSEQIRIPEISENVTTGKVVEVFVSPGDDIDVDDPVIEFETEKAVVEIPSPYKGRITKVLAGQGDEMSVGDVIAEIDTQADSGEKQSAPVKEDRRAAGEDALATAETAQTEPAAKSAAEPAAEKSEEKAEPARKAEPPTRKEPAKPDETKKRPPAPASPSVRRFARELGVEIHAVQPSGPGGRITEADVKAHVKKTLSGKGEGAAAAPGFFQQPELPDFSRWGEIEEQPLESVRRITARSMAVAWTTVPHVTQFEKVDVTEMNAFIRIHGDKAEKQGGKLTLTAVLMKVCAAALKRFPRFNASIDPENDRLILKKYVHIAMAVDTPRGLLVPVVRDADQKNLIELSVEIVDLAQRARNKKIRPDEMEGGTFTISNQGGIGGTNFTPVVFWPQAAILGISRAAVEPVYTDGEFRPLTILPLSLSYDHRLIDGADAARFIRWVRESIEHPMTLHLD